MVRYTLKAQKCSRSISLSIQYERFHHSSFTGLYLRQGMKLQLQWRIGYFYDCQDSTLTEESTALLDDFCLLVRGCVVRLMAFAPKTSFPSLDVAIVLIGRRSLRSSLELRKLPVIQLRHGSPDLSCIHCPR